MKISNKAKPDLRPRLAEGSLLGALISFAVPVLLSNTLQALYGAVDLMIVGHFSGGAAALSAVSNASQIIHVITLFLTGFASGGMVLVGQSVGAQKHAIVQAVIRIILCFFPLLGIALSILTVILAPWLLSVMNVPAEAAGAALAYLRICGGGLLITAGYNMFSAILRGLGDSKSPLFFIAVACVTNVLADLLLVGAFKLGATGAAYATVAAQGVSVLFAAKKMRDVGRQYSFSSWNAGIDLAALPRLIWLGLPIALEELLVSLSFMLITAMVNRFGLVVSSAIGITEKIASVSRLPAVSFSAAISAMVAQSAGANQPRRARHTMYMGILSALCLVCIPFLAMRFFPESLMRLYAADPDIIAVGCSYMHTYSYDTLLVCVTFCMAGFFTGSGKSLFVFFRNLASTLLVRVPLAYWFCHLSTLSMEHIGLAAPVASLASILIGSAYFFLFIVAALKNR